MPDRDPAILLDDIRRAIDKIAKYTTGLSKEAFISNDMVVDAVVRNLEVIAEAAKRLRNRSRTGIQKFLGVR